MSTSSTYIQALDLDDLDDEILQSDKDFDLIAYANAAATNEDNETPTLESILNEDDDEETDEILKSLNSTLTTLDTQRKTTQESKGGSSRRESQEQKLTRSRTTSSLNQMLTERNGIVVKQAILKQISNQVVVAIERSDAGLPTVLAIGVNTIAVGTSRGLVLIFDSLQALKLYITNDFKDAITALSLNNKCDRLLVGNALGYIFMFDQNGKCLRSILDACPSGNAILNLKFTDDSKLACFSDSGGSVFMLEFKRVMGIRGADLTCLFSGSRGEVCHIEPLKFEKFSETIIEKLNVNSIKSTSIKRHMNDTNELFNKYSLLAMASFTKIFIVSLRPKLTVLFTYPLSGNIKYLPIINWQFVIFQPQPQPNEKEEDPDNQQQNSPKRFITPILACARESLIYFFQINIDQAFHKSSEQQQQNSPQKGLTEDVHQKFKIKHLQTSEFNYKILNFCWLNAKTLAILDHTEKLHIVDIRSNEELQVMTNLAECVQLVFNSCFFKSLATGGYVSKALAYAGESACYQTFQSYLGQLFMLGSRSIILFSLQNWSARIDDFVNESKLELSLDLALNMYKGETKALIGLPIDAKLRKEKIVDKIIDILYLYINRAMKQDCPDNGKLELLEKHFKQCSSKCVKVCIIIERQDFLFENIYNLLSYDTLFEGFFFESLEEHILNNKLKQMPPTLIQRFIDYYISNPLLHANLEKCLLMFDVSKIDLHNVIQMTRANFLWDAYIHFFNKAFNDYVTPLEEIILIMRPHLFLIHETAKSHLNNEYIIEEQPTTSTLAAQAEVKQFLNSEQLVTCGNKLLVYMHCCLCGQSYPYGSIEDDQLSDKVRRQTFDYLISKRNKTFDALLLDEKKKTNSPLAKYLDQLLDLNESSLGNYPIIRMFLNFDILDFLNVISMTFNESSFEAVIGLDKKQQLIDILIEIGLGFSKTSVSQKTGQKSISSLNLKNNSQLFIFLARQIANKKNNIQVDNLIFSQIIEYLCNREQVNRTEEREQTLLSLLSSFSIQILEKFDFERLLNLALKAKFYRVCEILYEFRGEYYEIVDCYLNVDNSLERQQQIFNVVRGLLNILYETTNSSSKTPSIISKNSAMSILEQEKFRSYTLQQRRTSIALEPRDIQLKKLQEKLIDFFSLRQMIAMNASETIHLLWIEMNMDLKSLINTIIGFGKKTPPQTPNSLTGLVDLPENYDKDSSELLYKFMKGLFELADLIKSDRKYMNYMSQFAPDYCELYVDLICVHEPKKILYFLKTSLGDYTYRVDECLKICRNREVWDGAAYLLEKSGQIEAAFSLNLEKMSSLIKDLQKRLELLSERELNGLKSTIDAHLISIVQLCQRNSNSLSVSVKEKIWFELYDLVMNPIRSLFIHPSIEALLLNDITSAQSKTKNDNVIKIRLDETKVFFKDLGSYIINSMVGYLNLTTIIDKIICDPLYGASNFGDIKDLMCKMLEMCSYEQTLLTKCSSLVSSDVYEKMFSYKRISSKSFSSFTNFCQYCSKPLDESAKFENSSLYISTSNTNSFGSNNSPNSFIDSKLSAENGGSKPNKNSHLNGEVSIFHCGHSFHHSCLDLLETSKTSMCPLCNSSSFGFQSKGLKSPKNPNTDTVSNKNLTKKLKQKQHQKQQSSLGSIDVNINDLSTSPTKDSNKTLNESSSSTSSDHWDSSQSKSISLSENQLKALKSIRTRKQLNFVSANKLAGSAQSQLFFDSTNNNNTVNTMLERQSKLQLAPANLSKFIE